MKQKVHFKNGYWTLAGELYLPDSFNEQDKYPVLVICHPGGGVKEQTSALYADGMAKNGFIALTFDASHQGESEGEPRLLDNPIERSEDIKCGVDYLTTLPYVDRTRIVAAGSCAGAGYAIFATLTDRRIKAVCGICCTNPGATTRLGWDGKRTLEEQKKRLDEIAEQRTAEANGAPVRYAHYVPELGEIDENTYPDMVEANDYYRNPKRALHPNSPNKFRFTGMAYRMTFDAYQYIQDKRENLVGDLFSHSVIHYKGDSAPTSDSSPANVEKVNQILMDAIYSSYPKNIAPDDLDGAMVHVIQACDNERRKMIISEYYAYEEFFKAYPYCWSDHLIRKTWEISLKEEIITECDTD